MMAVLAAHWSSIEKTRIWADIRQQRVYPLHLY
jgi:hypothetical protein